MSVVIRLSRIGTKHVPFYRIVVVDSRKKRDGAVLENIGTYNAEKTELVCFNPERYNAWVNVGAQPSDTARKLYRLYKVHGAVQKAVDAQVETKQVQSAPKKAAKAAEKESEQTAASKA